MSDDRFDVLHDSLRGWVNRVRSSFRRRSLDERLTEEIKAHLDMATSENVARGMSPDEARTAALRSFGGVLKTREAYRDTAGWPGLEALWQDVRYAARTYRRTPAFAFIVILTLALAIGANTAIFSLLNALALRDLPVREPGTLVEVSTISPAQGESYLTFSMFRELSAQQKVFTSVIGAWGNTGVAVSDQRNSHERTSVGGNGQRLRRTGGTTRRGAAACCRRHGRRSTAR